MQGSSVSNPQFFHIDEVYSELDLESFDCGQKHSILSKHLKNKALKEQENLASLCYVLATNDAPRKIIGYFTLSSTSLKKDLLQGILSKSYIKKNFFYGEISALLLGRMAVDLNYQRQGYSSTLINEAILSASRTRVARLLLVQAKDEDLVDFYTSRHFTLIPGTMMLFMDLKDIPK